MTTIMKLMKMITLPAGANPTITSYNTTGSPARVKNIFSSNLTNALAYYNVCYVVAKSEIVGFVPGANPTIGSKNLHRHE
jgi:hypothetical protein